MSDTAAKQKRREQKIRGIDRRQPGTTSLRPDVLVVLAIVLVAFGARYCLLSSVGVTYDEPTYVSAGVQYIDGLEHLNFSGSFWSANMEHPPVSKYIYGAAICLMGGQIVTFGSYLDARLASALMGALTCALVYLIGRDFMSRKIGITSALLLSFLPVFLAHTEIAALESPLAFFFTLTVYLFMAALQRGSRNYLIGAAVACGLTLGTKYNGVFVLPVIALLYGMFALDRLRRKEGTLSMETLRRNLGALLPAREIAVFLAIACALFFVLWPWLWTDPIGHLSQSIGHWTYSPQEYFLGTLQTAPLYYYPVYFAVTTPVLLFIPLAAGAFALARSRDPFRVVLLLWLAIPFLYGLSPLVQGGMRYLIVIYPAVALICGCGLWGIAGWAGGRYRAWGREKVFFVISALAVVYAVLSSASVYPYFLDYYNVLAGGPQGAGEHRSFDIGWWGEGVSAAMGYVESTAAPGSPVLMATNPDDPTNTATEEDRLNYFYAGVVRMGYRDMTLNFSQPMVTLHQGQVTEVVPQYVITNFPVAEYQNVTMGDANYSLVWQVTVQGAPMVEVYKGK